MNIKDSISCENIQKIRSLGLSDSIIDILNNGSVIQRPIYYLYIGFAILSFLAPFYLAFVGLSNGLFDAPFRVVFGVFLGWIVFVITSFATALLWWGRKDEVLQFDNAPSSFPATHHFAHFIQVGGEAVAIICLLSGSLISVFFWLFAGEYNDFYDVGILGWKGVLVSVVLGIVFLLISRFLSEQFKALATIAKHTSYLKNSDIDSE